MVDYTKGTGSGGIMTIRDLGSDVEFLIRAGFESTFSDHIRWKRYVNGAWSGLLGPVSYDTGRPTIRLDRFQVNGNQNICFRLEDTNTQGLGGPTEFWQYIQRATVPQAPSQLARVGADSHTSVELIFSDRGTGGSAILERQIGYGTSPTKVMFTAKAVPGKEPTWAFNTIKGLSMGTTWYFWARSRNAAGWSAWSPRLSVRTLAGSRVRVAGVWEEAVPMVKTAGVWRQAIPFVRKSGIWKAGQ